MKIKISFSSIDMLSSPKEWMYRLEEEGFQGWEIIDEGSQRLEGEFKEKVKEIYETTNLKLSLHAPFSDLNIASLNERIWEESIKQIRGSISEIHELIEICVVHPGNYSPLSIQMPEKAKKKEFEALKILAKYASEYGIRVAVENMTSIEMLLGKNPEEMKRIMREVGMDNLGVCLDTGHANMTKTLNKWLRYDLDLKIIHMHANDNFGEKDEHLPLGKGNIDWKRLFDELKKNNYESLMVAEMKTIEEGIESLTFLKNKLFSQ